MRKNIVIVLLIIVVLAQWFIILNISGKKAKHVERGPAPGKPVVPEVVIIIDDWGYNLEYVDYLDKIKIPITVSIFPTAPHSKDVAELAHKKGFEIMIHQPLEPFPPENKLEKDTIMTGMSSDQINTILDSSVKTIGYAKGMNNHQGSKATLDERVMMIVLNKMKNKNMYFIDSLTSPNTATRPLSRTMGVKFAKRDIFIDNENNENYINEQIQFLIKRARKTGHAIGIGHYRPTTLKVISGLNSYQSDKTIRFVPASKLVK